MAPSRKKAKEKFTGKGRRKTEVTSSQPTSPSHSPVSINARELRKISEEISAAYFPRKRGTKVYLTEVDPFHAHVGWHITDNDLAKATKRILREQPGIPPSLILRIYDVTEAEGLRESEAYFFDVKVEGQENNWYVTFKEDYRSYYTELGMKGRGDMFISLAKSGVIHTPRFGPSPSLEVSPVRVTQDKQGRAQVLEEMAPLSKTAAVHYVPIDPLSPSVAAVAGKISDEVRQFPVALGIPETDVDLGFQKQTYTVDLTVAGPVLKPSGSHESAGPEQKKAVEYARTDVSGWMALSGAGPSRESDFLEIQARLRVWGRTRPGREIEFFGRKILADAEGCFSFHIDVPVDERILPALMRGAGGKPEEGDS